MKYHQIRNATAIIHYAGKKILIDPMLSVKGSFPGFPMTLNNHLRNPLVDLPMSVSDIINVDAIIVTHTHEDHWDAAARALIPRDMTIFVQNTADKQELTDDGFSNLHVLDEHSEFCGIKLIPTRAQHGSNEAFQNKDAAELLGEATGVILSAKNEKVIYLVGDSIWIDDVEKIMKSYQPEIVILNTGYALVDNFGPIIMGKDDVLRTHNVLPDAKIIATHMESVNHFGQTRKEIYDLVVANKIENCVFIPEDGEIVNI
ncbi:MBL fold metallo-hydrolase [Salmonella enterica]